MAAVETRLYTDISKLLAGKTSTREHAQRFESCHAKVEFGTRSTSHDIGGHYELSRFYWVHNLIDLFQIDLIANN